MDTGTDARFALLGKALLDLKRSLETGRIKAQFPRHKAADACSRGHAALMALQYSYATPEAIRAMPEHAALVGSAGEVEAILGGPGFDERIKDDALAVAEALWTIHAVRSLGARIDLPGAGFENAVDVAVGRVLSAGPHPAANNLLVTRVAAGRPLRVVTNDKTVKPDDRVGVALLPPVELRGIVSVGMFLGAGHGVLKDVDEGPLGRPQVPEAAYAETRNMVGRYVAGK